MASTIVTKNSSTASAVPLTGDLTQGELAVNVTDKRLFTKNSGGTVVELGTNPASLALPNGTANGVAYLNGSKVVTTGSALTFDGTALLTTARIDIQNANALQRFLNGTGTRTGYIQVRADAFEIWSDQSAIPMTFGVSNSEQMRLTSTGLGIGTSSPTTPLTIRTNGATSSTPTLTINPTTGTNAASIYMNNSGSGGFYIGRADSAGNGAQGSALPAYDSFIWNTGAQNLIFGTNNTERMRLDSSGNLGIGTSSPGSKLQVQGLIRTSSSAAGIQIDRRDTSTSAYTLYSSAGNLQFYNGTSDVMVLDSSGNLGLGVTPNLSGTTGLQIGSSVNRWTWVGPDENGYTVLGSNVYYNSGYKYAGSYAAGLYRMALNSHAWFTAPSGTAGNAISFTQAMTLDASGNLLVGITSASGRRLWVAGSNTGYISTIQNDNSSPLGLQIYHPTDVNGTGNSFLVCVGNATNRVELRSNGGIGNYSANNVNLSDERLKKDFQAAPSYYDRWLQINFVTFLYKDQTDDERNLGVKAGQLESVCPELIDNSGFGKAPEGEAPYKAVYQTDFQYATAVALQEAIKKIEQLTERITALEGK